MRTRFSSPLVTTILATTALAVSSAANAEFTINRVVNCDKGMDVQRVLDANIFRLPIELRLKGTCGYFEITQDDVSIAPLYDDACPGATVDGGIFLNGAGRIEMRCITVTGGDGIEAIKSDVLLEDVDIIDTDMGLQSTGHSTVAMAGGSVVDTHDTGVIVDSISLAFFEGTLIGSNEGRGIDASQNSSVACWSCSVSDNEAEGIFLDSKSNILMEGGDVSNSARGGVVLHAGSHADLIGVSITDNGWSGIGSGVFMRGGSSASIQNATIMRNSTGLGLLEHSFAVVGTGTEISENVRRGMLLGLDSGARLASDTVVPTQGSLNTAIQCNDKESSAEFDPAPGLIGIIECEDVGF